MSTLTMRTRAPGMALATLFVTLPFVVRELLPILEQMDMAEEEAAQTLGASDWQVCGRQMGGPQSVPKRGAGGGCVCVCGGGGRTPTAPPPHARACRSSAT